MKTKSKFMKDEAGFRRVGECKIARTLNGKHK